MADSVSTVLTSYFAHVKTWIGNLTHQLRDHLELYDPQNWTCFEEFFAQKLTRFFLKTDHGKGLTTLDCNTNSNFSQIEALSQQCKVMAGQGFKSVGVILNFARKSESG